MRDWVPTCRSHVRLALAVAGTLVLAAGAVAGSNNYLIVSAPEYAGSAPLDQFIAHRTARGFHVLPVYVPPAGTSREAIKAYIQGLWGTPDAPEYLLLIGDTDGATSGQATIPHWTGGGSRTAPTDLPYACMDSEPISWYPDMYYGRFSVRDVPTLQAVVNKTIAVETGGYSDPNYIRRVAMLATEDPTAMADALHDEMIATYMEPAGFTATRVYADAGGGTGDISAAVNDGVLFTVYFGHSTSGGWWSPSFTQSNVQALTNDGLYGLAMGWSCNSASYPTTECFGETWLRVADRGAAAYLSASTLVWWGTTDAWESSRRMERYFFQSVFEDNIWLVSPAWQAALARIYADPDFGPTHDHTRNIFEEFVLLGDPALRLPFRALDFELAEPVPEFIPPGAPTPLTVRIRSAAELYQPDSGLLHYRMSLGDYESLALTPLGDDLFAAVLPPADCGTTPCFYFSAQGDQGTTIMFPEHAPGEHFSCNVAVVTTLFADDFESEQGWTVQSIDLTDGAWERGVPVDDGEQGDPTIDFDGSGRCFLTGNELGNSDVDGGPTILTSPALDLTGWTNPYVRLGLWFHCDDPVPPAQDFLDIEISADDGATWVPAQHLATLDGWSVRDIRVLSHVELSAQCRVRLVVADNPNDSLTEAGLDAVWVHERFCGEQIERGDVNCDGVVNAFDIDVFVFVLSFGGGPPPQMWEYCGGDFEASRLRADANGDGALDAFDIDAFVELLTGAL